MFLSLITSILISLLFCFFFNDTATTEIYTLSLHDALPISRRAVSTSWSGSSCSPSIAPLKPRDRMSTRLNSSHDQISYAVFCLKKKTLHALLTLNRNEPLKAIEALQPATPYELGIMAMGAGLYTVYVRGEAYLAAREGGQAAGEFQKITDRRSIGLNPVGALAHLGLARAFVLQGDVVKAKAAYQDFFTLWKVADPDIPIFSTAKAEYAKLK